MAPRKKGSEPCETWENSRAKQIVRRGYIDETIPLTMPMDDIIELNPEVHKKWPVKQWKQNVRNLRKAIKRDKDRAMEDWLNYKVDIAKLKTNRPDNRKVPWHLSEAAEYLKQDMAKGKHLEMKPRELYLTRPSYQEFDLRTFRKHIYQRKDAEPKRQWRFEKKMEKTKYPEVYEDHPRYAKYISSKEEKALFT